MLLLKSSLSAVLLTPDNTAHSGDNTLCLLGAKWLQGGLLSKAAFTHRAVQQVTDLYKPHKLHRMQVEEGGRGPACMYDISDYMLTGGSVEGWLWKDPVNTLKVLPLLGCYKVRGSWTSPVCAFSIHWGQFIVIDMVCSGQSNFADLYCTLVKFNMSKRPWPDGHKDSKLLPQLSNKSEQLIIII